MDEPIDLPGVTCTVSDFIGNIYRRRAEKIAQQINKNFEDINNALHNGSITLGEAIADMQAQVESARAQLTHGKIGKKGGKAMFEEIERNAQQQIEELRRQARETQRAFINDLRVMRLPQEQRDASRGNAITREVM